MALLSGRRSDAAYHRARELGINRFHEGLRDKVAVMEEIMAAMGIEAFQAAMVGDDLVDLPIMSRAGLAVAVADAVPEVLAVAHWVTSLPGGHGAVRQVCDLLIKARGKWGEMVRPWMEPPRLNKSRAGRDSKDDAITQGFQSYMLRRVLRSPVACLMLVITAMLSVGYSSCAHAPASWSALQPQLVFSTYLGGSIPFMPGASPITFAQGAACDAQGNTYVTGATWVADLPVKNAFQPAPAADSATSAFVAKYNPVGKMLWCTYLGGNQQSKGAGAAAMPDGGVAVAGLTTSDALGPFPTTITAFQAQNNGQSDYFVSVFDANGNLKYSTCLGGSGVEGPPAPFTFADDNAPATSSRWMRPAWSMSPASPIPAAGPGRSNSL